MVGNKPHPSSATSPPLLSNKPTSPYQQAPHLLSNKPHPLFNWKSVRNFQLQGFQRGQCGAPHPYLIISEVLLLHSAFHYGNGLAEGCQVHCPHPLALHHMRVGCFVGLATVGTSREANGLVEHFHRQMKASLKACTTTNGWLDSLLVLLGSRTELVYGTALRVLGEFFCSRHWPPHFWSINLCCSVEVGYVILDFEGNSTMRRFEPSIFCSQESDDMPICVCTAWCCAQSTASPIWWTIQGFTPIRQTFHPRPQWAWGGNFDQSTQTCLHG